MATPSRLKLPPLDEEASSANWSLVAWAKNAGAHRVVAAAISHQAGSDDSAAALKLLRGFKSRADVERMLNNAAVIGSLVDVVWEETERLQQAAAATNEEVSDKFAGAIELKYDTLVRATRRENTRASNPSDSCTRATMTPEL